MKKVFFYYYGTTKLKFDLLKKKNFDWDIK